MFAHHYFSFLSVHRTVCAVTSGPIAARHPPGLRRSGRCQGRRTRAGSTIRVDLRSAPRRAGPWRPPPMRRRDGDWSARSATPWASAVPDVADRRASRSRAVAVVCRAADAGFDHAAAGSAPSASMSAARSSTFASRRGADGAAAAAAVDTAMPEVRHAANTSRVDATANASESSGGASGAATLAGDAPPRALVGPAPIRSAAANNNAACSCLGSRSLRSSLRCDPHSRSPSGAHVSARPVMRSDHSRPQQASVTPTTSSHPPAPPASRKLQRVCPDELTEADAEHRQAGQHRRRGAGACHPGVDPGREPFALNDVAMRGAHQRRDRQAVRLRQPPEQSQSLPVRRQTRRLGEAAQPGGHVGAQPRSCGDGAQAVRDGAVDLACRDIERGDRMGADPQFADQHVQRTLQCGRLLRARARRAFAPVVVAASACPRGSAAASAAATRQHHRQSPRRARRRPPSPGNRRRVVALRASRRRVGVGATTSANARASAAPVTARPVRVSRLVRSVGAAAESAGRRATRSPPRPSRRRLAAAPRSR